MRILRDSFPVQVKLHAREGAPSTDHTFYAARAIVSDTELIVFADHASGPVIVFRAPHKGDETDLDSPLYTHAVIQPDLGCGCGSRLRALNPYRSITA